jgi:methionyl-tRNA formyltransferase
MTKLRVIFMGTPAFAMPALEKLVSSPHRVVAVYSQPPRPSGRGQKVTPSLTHQFAEQHGIPVFTPTSLKSETEQQIFRDLGADIAVVAAYGLLLPKAILEGTRLGCINIHPSKLPRWRGAAPIQRTIMAGDTQTAMCIMQMNEWLDTGDILLQRDVNIPDGTTATTLHDSMSQLGADCVLDVLNSIETIRPILQSEEGVTYAKKITKEECRINWSQPAQAVRAHILGLSDKPGAFFLYHDEIIKVLDAEIYQSSKPFTGMKPGTIADEHLTIACAQGAISPTVLQRAGKKPTSSREFLQGFTISRGEVLE